eukprot:gene8001-8824_t
MLGQYEKLALTGATLGLVHVLAGPDHLSALAALSVGTSYKAFLLGLRWGLGHSAGLLIVAVAFIILKGDIDLRRLGRYCDSLVGLFMILLGCYGAVTALRLHRQKLQKRETSSQWDEEEASLIDRSTTLPFSSSSSSKKHLIDETRRGGHHNRSSSLPASSSSSSSSSSSHVFTTDHIMEECPCAAWMDINDSQTQRWLSLAIGILHGIAGPGGILGVLPAVEMQNIRLSTTYLGSFILSSTLSMGLFAAIYGEATRRLSAAAAEVDLCLRVGSAALSVLVGAVWFVLSVLGKLEDLFH